jgi:hypothetical protein
MRLDRVSSICSLTNDAGTPVDRSRSKAVLVVAKYSRPVESFTPWQEK